MKAGIVGLPNVGKRTLFGLLTERDPSSIDYKKSNVGTVKVPDKRLDIIYELLQPKVKTYTTIDFILLNSIERGDGKRTGVFAEIAGVDVIVHLVRAFQDQNIFHLYGSIDPLRDIELVNYEFILSDLAIAEEKLNRLKSTLQKRKDPEEKIEFDALTVVYKALQEGIPVRNVPLSSIQEKKLRGYKFLSQKPQLIILNVGEEDLPKTDDLFIISEKFGDSSLKVMKLSAKIEKELADLTPEDAQEFMKDLGIAESALDRLIRQVYELLGLITFFTCNNQEAKAWTLPKGQTVLKAAGQIHSDMERGFIRAEVMPFATLQKYGSWTKARDEGAVLVKGRDYIVEDGDLIQIRFNI